MQIPGASWPANPVELVNYKFSKRSFFKAVTVMMMVITRSRARRNDSTALAVLPENSC